jgi:hypothetical protein
MRFTASIDTQLQAESQILIYDTDLPDITYFTYE